MTADRPPRTDAEWARDTNRRLSDVEHPDAARAGPWVLSADAESGDLIASHVDGGSVRLAKVPASDTNPDTVVVEEEDAILWTNPVLASGWDLLGNPASIDPVKFRKIRMAGIDIIQCSGAVHVASGAPSLIWIMDEEYRPVVNLAPILVARGFGGGSVAAQIDVRADGTINLVGATAAPTLSTDAAGNGTTGGSNTTYTGYQDGGTGGSPGCPNCAGPNTGAPSNGGDGHTHFVGGHGHNIAGHTHNVGSHTHTGDVITGYPDFLSFNGVWWPL